jgi:hypothetical protein
MNLMFYGMLAAMAWVCALFFLRFWTRTRETLFAAFAASFFFLGLNWFILGAFTIPDESSHFVYLVRLVAFLVLLGGIAAKNFETRRR